MKCMAYKKQYNCVIYKNILLNIKAMVIHKPVRAIVLLAVV